MGATDENAAMSEVDVAVNRLGDLLEDVGGHRNEAKARAFIKALLPAMTKLARDSDEIKDDALDPVVTDTSVSGQGSGQADPA